MSGFSDSAYNAKIKTFQNYNTNICTQTDACPYLIRLRNICTDQIFTFHTLWRMRLQAMPTHKNPLTELRCASLVYPWIALLGRKVLAVPSTSAATERMSPSAGNIMTKKRARLSCNHLEELMYLHEVWLKVRERTAIKKVRLV